MKEDRPSMTPTTPAANKSLHSQRTLKIEAVGEYWRGQVKPKILLTGKWFEQMGFVLGRRVNVSCSAPGVLNYAAKNSRNRG
jgi:hypothetical protein